MDDRERRAQENPAVCACLWKDSARDGYDVGRLPKFGKLLREGDMCLMILPAFAAQVTSLMFALIFSLSK